jgi:hypothetical protein
MPFFARLIQNFAYVSTNSIRRRAPIARGRALLPASERDVTARKKMEGSVACERTFHSSRSRFRPAARRDRQRRASLRLIRYAIFSFSSWFSFSLLSSWLLFSLLFSLPLFVTSFWLTKFLCLFLDATTLVYIKELHEQITEKSKKYFYIFFIV